MSVLPGSLKISVYSGLTLSEADVHAILPSATARPPVKQFDLLSDIKEGAHVVVIVDGVFHQSPAVSPSEIMDALRRGLSVYGCSSMGALRAAELWPYGMKGHGKIYEWVRSTPVFRDDFPGQVFTRDGDRLKPLSLTHVDFVFNLARLKDAAEISESDRAFLEETFRDLYYPERTLGALVAKLKGTRADLIPVATRALTQMESQKRLDALSTLERVKKDLLETARVNASFEPPASPRARRRSAARRHTPSPSRIYR